MLRARRQGPWFLVLEVRCRSSHCLHVRVPADMRSMLKDRTLVLFSLVLQREKP